MIEYSAPVDMLLTLGDTRTSVRRWPNYLEYGFRAEHIPALIDMATDRDLNLADPESVEVWAPMHAWRVLGQLRAEDAIFPLLNLLDELEDDDWVREELPYVYGMIGSAAIPALKSFVADSSRELFARITAAHGLALIGLQHPESRIPCIGVLTLQLELFQKNERELNGFLICYLVDLNAVTEAPLMARAFASRRVDETIMGDWVDVQMELGLIDYYDRKPDSDFFLDNDFSEIFEVVEPSAKQRAKTKVKRKLSQQSRKQNRKKKKKKKK